MQHVAVVAGIQIGPADQHNAVEEVEDAVHVVRFGQWRNNHWNAADGGDAIVIAGSYVRERGCIFFRRTEVCVQTE